MYAGGPAQRFEGALLHVAWHDQRVSTLSPSGGLSPSEGALRVTKHPPAHTWGACGCTLPCQGGTLGGGSSEMSPMATGRVAAKRTPMCLTFREKIMDSQELCV